MKKIMLTASILVMQAGVAAAQVLIPGGPTTGGTGSSGKVPEISALEGMAAIAALAAVMLLVWERRRRSV